ncbi:MAG: ABC transporter permease, partial [Planctomycetes bacterium]|nr:ABC transporter permease [Planctomycetota bacterium]
IYGLDPKSRIIENAKKEEGGGTLVPTDRRKVAMGNSLARKLDKKVGDKVELTGGFEFEIIGIFESNNLLESNGAVMPIAEMQEILNQPNKVTTMLIILKQSHKAPEKVALVKSQIEALRDPAGKSLNIDVQSTRDHVSTNMETQALKGLAWAASLIAILIGFVSMLNTMMMSIAERIREIATFRAIGWRKWRIMRMIFMESLILSIVGAVVGVLLAIPLMEFLANFSMTSSLVTSKLTLETLAKGIGMGLIAGFLGSVYPAFIAANLSPASALRHE